MSQAEEAALRRLLEEAGPRPALPPEDLAAIAATARAAWRDKVQVEVEAGRFGESRARRRSSWPLALALAAALVLALGAAWLRVSLAPRPGPQIARVEAASGPLYLVGAAGERAVAAGEALAAGATLRTGRAGETPARASLRLDGGPILRLDSGTRVRLISAAALDLEMGGVYLDVRPGARGLEVRTGLGIARDVGTQFSVRLAGGGEEALVVRVREGAVAVEGHEATHVAAAGEELVLRSGGAVERRAIAGWGPDWNWVLESTGGFEVEGRSLRELLDWVGRETGWQVRYADPELAVQAETILVGGTIAGLRPDQAPWAVLPGADLEGELAEGVLTVRRRDGAGVRTPR
jgi:hypothetical protein